MGNLNKTLTLGTLLSVASYAAGGYHGFMDAQGNPMPEKLEDTLTYVPAAAGAVFGGIGSLIGGAAVGISVVDRNFLTGGIAGGAAGAVVGAGFGGLYRGFQTLVGYGVGYLVGALSR